MRYILLGILLCLGVSAYEEYGDYQEYGNYGEKVCEVDVLRHSRHEVDNEFCEHGCCGDPVHHDRRCCDSGGGNTNTNTNTNVNFNLGMYLGVGGGSTGFLIMICICCYCYKKVCK
ncbi:uncharacterized protein LOC123555687 [Mercenaria mercenaria]|uniref:uncharacterized protein LOC123555687 n=1 Tax=Mercenaria mercenaria TaxID=6596 RepID=UPI00234F944D|nr:uncharacterized protein LOC123555687 [Mercenaria mercenaria]